MPSLKYLITLLSISILSLRLVNSHLISIPSCVQECIEQSPDIKCSSDDIPCLCVSTKNVLSGIISCIQNTCRNHLDTTTLLTPLQLACQLAGHPIPIPITSAQTPSGTIIITIIPTQTSSTPLSTSTLIITTIPNPSSPQTTATTQASTLYPYLGTRPTSQAIGASTSSSAVTQLSGTRSSTGTGTGMGETVGSKTSTGALSPSTSPNSAETNGSPFQDGSSSFASCRGKGGWMLSMGIVFLIGNLLL